MAPTFLKTSKPVTIRPTFLSSPTPLPSHRIVNITLSSEGTYSQPTDNVPGGVIHYMINSTNIITIISATIAQSRFNHYVYTVIPNENSTLNIQYFNNATDVIDLHAFAPFHINTYTDLNITSGSVVISLPRGQVIRLFNLHPEDISEDNFIFSNYTTISEIVPTTHNSHVLFGDTEFNTTEVIIIAGSVILLFTLWFCYSSHIPFLSFIYKSVMHKSKADELISPMLTYTNHDFDSMNSLLSSNNSSSNTSYSVGPRHRFDSHESCSVDRSQTDSSDSSASRSADSSYVEESVKSVRSMTLSMMPKNQQYGIECDTIMSSQLNINDVVIFEEQKLDDTTHHKVQESQPDHASHYIPLHMPIMPIITAVGESRIGSELGSGSDSGSNSSSCSDDSLDSVASSSHNSCSHSTHSAVVECGVLDSLPTLQQSASSHSLQQGSGSGGWHQRNRARTATYDTVFSRDSDAYSDDDDKSEAKSFDRLPTPALSSPLLHRDNSSRRSHRHRARTATSETILSRDLDGVHNDDSAKRPCSLRRRNRTCTATNESIRSGNMNSVHSDEIVRDSSTQLRNRARTATYDTVFSRDLDAYSDDDDKSEAKSFDRLPTSVLSSVLSQSQFGNSLHQRNRVLSGDLNFVQSDDCRDSEKRKERESAGV